MTKTEKFLNLGDQIWPYVAGFYTGQVGLAAYKAKVLGPEQLFSPEVVVPTAIFTAFLTVGKLLLSQLEEKKRAHSSNIENKVEVKKVKLRK